MKKALTSIVAAGALVALAVPAANARMLPATHATRAQAAKKVTAVAKESTPRVLCICISAPPAPAAVTQLAYEVQANADAADHGEPPVYDLSGDSSDSGATS